MRESVSLVRQLIQEAREPRATDSPELQLQRAYEFYEINKAPPPLIDQSPRGRLCRQVERIVAWYPWGGPELERALDAARAASAFQLDDADLEQLVGRLQKLEECAQNGYDAPDCAPAT
jgi:hypothetical protein